MKAAADARASAKSIEDWLVRAGSGGQPSAALLETGKR